MALFASPLAAVSTVLFGRLAGYRDLHGAAVWSLIPSLHTEATNVSEEVVPLLTLHVTCERKRQSQRR